jgi:ABC-2 type transport system ATP-binding protein
VLDRGRVVAQGTADELKRRVAEQRLMLTFAGRDGFDRTAAALGDRALAVEAEGSRSPPTGPPDTSARCSTNSTPTTA